MITEKLRDMILDKDEEGIKKLIPANTPNVAALVNESISLPDRDDYPFFYRTKSGSTGTPVFSALHYAVTNVLVECERGLESGRKALSICKLLLRRGADPTKQASNVTIVCASDRTANVIKAKSAFTLAKCVIKAHSIDWKHPKYGRLFIKFTISLVTARHNQSNKNNGNIAIPQNLQELLANFRSCPDNDRMTFVCSDGVDIRAHRSVLSLYSPVFKAYFEGPWSETHPDGRWETTYASDLINAILDYIYTGRVNDQYISANCQRVYAAAHEFQMAKLTALAREYMIDGIDHSNIKSRLEVAHLHNDEDMLDACFDFVGSNSITVLLEPSFALLITEKPDLWQRMFRYLLPTRPYNSAPLEESKKRAIEDEEGQDDEKRAKLSESVDDESNAEDSTSSTV
jgi:BTB/POZ domain